MSKLTIMRGVSGSGKSTIARSIPNAVVVSRDDLRVALFGSDGPDYYAIDKKTLRQREEVVTEAEHNAIRQGLRGGFHVISDNTNVRMRHVNAIAAIGYAEGASVETHVVDVPLKVALERNKARAATGGRDVPESAIRRQHDSFAQSKKHEPQKPFVPEPYEGTPGKPKAFMVDIDGTLAHMRDYRKPYDWDKVHIDDLDEVVADIVRTINVPLEYFIVVMSGRDGSCQEATEAWLKKNHIPYDELFMRAEGDMRKDSVVKAELFDNHVRDNYDVQFVLDDRNQVVAMWRAMGIKTLQVEPGDF